MGQKLFSEISKELKGTRDMTNGFDKRENLWAKIRDSNIPTRVILNFFSTTVKKKFIIQENS